MKYMYWTIANAINSDYCDELVKRYRLSKEIATTELGNGGYDDKVRRSEVSWVEDKDVIDMIRSVIFTGSFEFSYITSNTSNSSF